MKYKLKRMTGNRGKFEPIHPFSPSKSFLKDPCLKNRQSSVIMFKFTDSILHFHCTDMYTYKEAERTSVCKMNSKPQQTLQCPSTNRCIHASKTSPKLECNGLKIRMHNLFKISQHYIFICYCYRFLTQSKKHLSLIDK